MTRNMDPDTEVESIFRHENGEEEKKKWTRPPSSYGSMKSDSDHTMEDVEEGKEEGVAVTFHPPLPVVQPDVLINDGTRMQMIRPDSPETYYTMNTQHTKQAGGLVIDTRSSDLGDVPENDLEDADEPLLADSPEPPMPVEPEETTSENSQPGTLHPEQDLPHIFKSIQHVLTSLPFKDLLTFKTWFYQCERDLSQKQAMEGDLLDFVDMILEKLGQDRSLSHTIQTLKSIGKIEEADTLRIMCKRALVRFQLQQELSRKYKYIHEGVVQAGNQTLFESIYVEPQISTCGYGGVDPSHEFRPHPPTHLKVPSPHTFVGLNDLLRLQKEDGQPARTVVTTGFAGMGMSVSKAKFCLNWAEMRANKDLQFVFKLSFRNFWTLRQNESHIAKTMSIMDVLEYYYPECKDMKYLEDEDCKFVIVMDSLDCYREPLDWLNAPVINDNVTKVTPGVLVVNIVRGTVLRGARVWILGRRTAISQIPTQFIDVFTEIQGFSDTMKDEYLTKRYEDAALAAKIVAHYKLLPSLVILTRQPFVCWMVATMFKRSFKYRGYGENPPRLTPFYINVLVVQMNRRLEFYYGKAENELKWSPEDKHVATKIGKMAFKMLEKDISVFCEEDVKEYGVSFKEVTLLSGLCTELPSSDVKRFCFIHFSVQEFMAAVYVFTMFREESKNVLESMLLPRTKFFASKDQTRSVAGVVQSALTRTLSSPLGHYDMFLRFLCGLLAPDCHDIQLAGFLFRYHMPKVGGLDETQRLLKQAIKTAEVKNRDRVGNLKECLREMIQTDE
ncbi:NLR family CARD domain-containing protein 3 isoform X1 [Pseudochaenichthys georgianus]|uniref:NLR family CARD domain-containing protein 3 isoform X1 n=1 Tax=Pseudochaenichthys georgianus TaxID=52239 RepID=UPI00146D8056|nr:NLR family CARD domain-containing protein 3 isoform X1 [Pseudochaenichthys georgianus]